ncbi:hypothetical protein B7463_g10672, partial [Scytalidium lignicola]
MVSETIVEQLLVIVVGGGLGGLGAAISILLAGHRVIVLESAHEVGEKGQHLTSLDFVESGRKYKSPFWDFHRADLYNCLYDRAIELGADVRINSRVVQLKFPPFNDESLGTTVVLSDGRTVTADLVVGADGIASRTRECFLGREDLPTPTGDLAYRVLLDTADLDMDDSFKWLLSTKEVNYWMGPDCHAVSYRLRGGKMVNNDIPDDGTKTVTGDVQEMRDLFKDWDPRIGKILERCDSVQKWKLCIRHELPKWSHPSGTFTMLGDAVHATLPYLASGQQYLYHLHDGPEQRERDRLFQLHPTLPGDPLVWRDPELSPWLLGYDHVKDVEVRWNATLARM